MEMGIVFLVLVVAAIIFLVWCYTTEEGERFKAEWWPELMELFTLIGEARGQWRRDREDRRSKLDTD
jgi:hypothetical protein